METDLFTYLLGRIAERKGYIEEGLAIGGAKDYEEYCKMVGGYAILREMEEEIKEIEKRYLDN